MLLSRSRGILEPMPANTATIHYVCTVRSSRAKAVELARAEVAALLRDCDLSLPAGGPLSERPGIYWVDLAEVHARTMEERAPRLGYTERIEELAATGPPRRNRPDGPLKWKGSWYEPLTLWESDPEEVRLSSPDMRDFALRGEDGSVRIARGYRGDGSSLGPKALPVPDCRLLVNLVFAQDIRSLLDPFAGAGGIVHEASRNGYSVTSMDVEPTVAPGLEGFGATHHVGDAGAMPFDSASFDAIATELPYAEETPEAVRRWTDETLRVLRPGARCAVMCSLAQREVIAAAASRSGAVVELCEEVDRRGTDVAVLVLHR